MPNQFTVNGEDKAKGERKAKGRPRTAPDHEGVVLTARQQRFFLNLATERFPTLKACAIDAGYAITSAETNCVTMAKAYGEYIEALRLELWTDETMEEKKKTVRLAKIVLKDLALSSANDNVRRLASRDLLELAGVLKAVQDKPDDLSPKDLRQEAQRVAQAMQAQTIPAQVN